MLTTMMALYGGNCRPDPEVVGFVHLLSLFLVRIMVLLEASLLYFGGRAGGVFLLEHHSSSFLKTYRCLRKDYDGYLFIARGREAPTLQHCRDDTNKTVMLLFL